MHSFIVVKMLVVNERGELLALKRRHDDFNRPGQWDFPGGNVDEGEDVQVAAIRETREETGIAPGALELVYGMSKVNPKGSGTWLFFVARVHDRPAVRLSHEHEAYAWETTTDFLAKSEYDVHISMLQYLLEHAVVPEWSHP